ncbi:MAG: peroxiredoxin [Candidatus Binatia bacterium]|nr:MAG: peroxiredoxin [Candidatus Binatia bacterium]
MLSVGDRAPEIEGTLSTGEPFRLGELRGKKHVVLYFFPRAFTPGCTRETCSFRDRTSEFHALDAEIVGVSPDPPEKQQAFAREYGVSFPFLTDRSGEIARAFGVARLGGWLPPRRVTFVVDKDGTIREVIHAELAIGHHIERALEALRALQAG